MASVRDRFKYSGEASGNDPAWRVVIHLGPSRRASAWAWGVTAVALAASLAAQVPWPAKAVAAFALPVAMVRSLRRHGARESPGSIRRLVVDLSGSVEAGRADGATATGRLAPDAFVAPWLTVLRWVPDGARLSRAIVILPDAVDATAFRRLRILLRWRG
jgi:toxin CptA